MSKHWVRFKDGEAVRFGVLEGHQIRVCEGDMFTNAVFTEHFLPIESVKLLMPVQPTKVIALWNNFKALGDKLQLAVPAEPLYFLKPPNSWLNPNEVIRQPAQGGKIIFEGELAVVIGRLAKDVSEQNAMQHVLGYTCLNDVTHADILNRDASFTQWVRSKGFDTFCPFGPAVVTDIDPVTLVVKTTLNGSVRQEFPISDMRFSVAQLVSRISHDMTLVPGDLISCGTSLGVGSMKPGSDIKIQIAGIGILSNRFE